MTAEARRVLELVPALPSEARQEVTEALIETYAEVPPEVEAAWIEEAERRYEESKAGLVQTIPWEVVRERARRHVSGLADG